MSAIMGSMVLVAVLFLLGAGFVFGLMYGTATGLHIGRWIYAKLTKAEKTGQASVPYKIGRAE